VKLARMRLFSSSPILKARRDCRNDYELPIQGPFVRSAIAVKHMRRGTAADICQDIWLKGAWVSSHHVQIYILMVLLFVQGHEIVCCWHFVWANRFYSQRAPAAGQSCDSGLRLVSICCYLRLTVGMDMSNLCLITAKVWSASSRW
jgi:hypothetical protein